MSVLEKHGIDHFADEWKRKAHNKEVRLDSLSNLEPLP